MERQTTETVEKPDAPSGEITAGASTADRATRGRVRVALWIAAAVVIVLFLAALGYAEAVWLHRDLPQDRASRVALVIYAGGGRPATLASSAPDWTTRLSQQAQDLDLLRDVIAAEDLRDRSTGQRWTAERLRSAMTVSGQCADVTDDAGQTGRGMLLVVVVRGADTHETDDVLHTWLERFQRRSALAFPGVVMQPVDSFRGTYAICQ